MKNIFKNYSVIACLLLVQIGLSQTVFRGTVIDQDTQKPIANAKVGVVGQGVGEITNEKGN